MKFSFSICFQVVVLLLAFICLIESYRVNAEPANSDTQSYHPKMSRIIRVGRATQPNRAYKKMRIFPRVGRTVPLNEDDKFSLPCTLAVLNYDKSENMEPEDDLEAFVGPPYTNQE
ncbi:uncharacterized protein [Diabrotica undecimpunctata]|uniref:uncharacterized protein n=1 Tax=Diabrotica undecimpunctata TaxID=50387 RepID=UPI003B63788E